MEDKNEEHTISKPKQVGRKRSLDEVQERTETMQLDGSQPATSGSISTMRLEAIFHPKFENEKRHDQDIRKEMKSMVESGHGHIEVSLKWSGSLMLWSGAHGRYYSKNSTDNVFTMVGEMLLRQHFCRAWKGEREGESAYKECSRFVGDRRLTLSFEVVTAVLGHHGDLPNRDFLILTAVADRSVPKFYTTTEVLQFAQRFRLPHNDVWVFDRTNIDPLFHLYDTTREVGLASDTIASLDASASVRIQSMYPHVEFQSDILEGLVIRFVQKSGEDDAGVLKEVASKSQELLRLCPPSSPPSFEMKPISPILATDVRQVMNDCIDDGGYNNALTNRFADQVSKLFQSSDGGRRRRVQRLRYRDWQIPDIAEQVLAKGDAGDVESQRVAKAIRMASNLKAKISYGIYREKGGVDANERTLCIVHVLHDETFQKYQRAMGTGDMPLYRGFCIELAPPHAANKSNGKRQETQSSPMEVEPMVPEVTSKKTLMLKMKFLPYMVRTFGCRNGLKTIRSEGPKAFAIYTMKLLTMWGMSDEAIAKWQPWFRAWSAYASDVLIGKETYVRKEDGLPPLTESFYLSHLTHFQALYDDGKIQEEDGDDKFAKSTFRGLVVVVAPTSQVSQEFAERLSEALGTVRFQHGLELSSEGLVNMKLPVGGGLIASSEVASARGTFRKQMGKYGDATAIVMVGCDDSSLGNLLLPEKDRKRLAGQSRGWKKTACHQVFEIGTTDGVSSLVPSLKAMSDSIAPIDIRPGLLVFFPGIPGSGKSTLSSNQSTKTLEEQLKVDASNSRQLTVLIGDKVKSKYWGEVKERRLQNSSSVLVADKNAPPNAWRTIGQSTGRGRTVPVIPDARSLSTTQVKGILRPSGARDVNVLHHYPFSLHYLALCMARVMERPARSHAGKLDQGTPAACMVVIKFYGFYRNIASDVFLTDVSRGVGSGGASCLPPIQVPFFGEKQLPELPKELSDGLEEAIRVQYGYDLEHVDTADGKRAEILQMEKRLRQLIENHKSILLSMACDVDTSSNAFAEQLQKSVDIVSGGADVLAERSLHCAPPKGADFVGLVSIDIPVEVIHGIIKSRAEELQGFLGKAWGKKELPQGNLDGNSFVVNTHVTMAHSSEFTQGNIHSLYDKLVGNDVDVQVESIAWNDRVAALAVNVADVSSQNIAVPRSQNKFCHVTVWCTSNAKTVESNSLPQLVEEGAAHMVKFAKPALIKGTIAYWTGGKRSRNG